MNPLNWLRMSKEIVKEKPELVITQYWMPFMAPAFGTILRGIKKELPHCRIATVVHNFKPHESRIGDQQLNKFIANRTDLLVALSDSVQNEIIEKLPTRKVTKIFHPVYDHYGEPLEQARAKTQLGWSDDTKYLLFFGLVRAYKGIDLLIEAMSLTQTTQKYKVYIAGEFYEDRKKYDALIEKYQLTDQIIIRDEYLPNEEVPKVFCAADAIILPYKTATQSGVVPIALHFERPVIVTRVGSLAEKIEKYNLGLIAESTPQSIAQQIDCFFDESQALAADYSAIKKELSWQTFYDLFISELSGHEL